MKTELETFKELVKIQDEFIRKLRDFGSSMPFFMGDVIEGYNDYIRKIDVLKEQLEIQ